MRKLLTSVGLLASTLILYSGTAAAQCDGGTTNAGYYARNGSYVSGGCAGSTASMTTQPAVAAGAFGVGLSAVPGPAAPSAAPSGGSLSVSPAPGARTVSNGPASPPGGAASPRASNSNSSASTPGPDPNLEALVGLNGLGLMGGVQLYPGGALGAAAAASGSADASSAPATPRLDGSNNLTAGAPVVTLPTTTQGAASGIASSLATAPSGLAQQIVVDGGSAYGYSLPAAPGPSPTPNRP